MPHFFCPLIYTTDDFFASFEDSRSNIPSAVSAFGNSSSSSSSKPKRSAPPTSAPPPADMGRFANAKSISSDQYFRSDQPTPEEQARLSQFSGQASISSDMYFGRGQQSSSSSSGGGGGGRQTREKLREFASNLVDKLQGQIRLSKSPQ
ncbi:hypothetical protein PTSG_07333 [Salpingoeca rosetta]|uniref:Uncharacterized protein n=1 Tax=Salpingoeca rosetta (strain ATCC 50818 / BSB-021) TaxID=946362 RepID=F2UJ42_SALR5|nr:uncharacterized protein PTSG_07333 [Salpingoeca rosetta]EGD76990.1 hypothetical protein PTSG_07333 [Salpingoeca rosetta]|eukprot:XP_004990830.1 hypothetical protein PTSG_07333 [Salpingoeca rosetta]